MGGVAATVEQQQADCYSDKQKAVRMENDKKTLNIETGCIENIKYDDHKRCKNWVATVSINKAAPGGLDRTFWQRGSGEWVVIPEGLEAGQVIEFAGDYYSGSGRKNSRRTYALITQITPTHLSAIISENENDLFEINLEPKEKINPETMTLRKLIEMAKELKPDGYLDLHRSWHDDAR